MINNSIVIAGGFLLRVGFFLFGLYQDATMDVKYTDIDYIVFTDAARYIWKYGQSPYMRETYRYTPLLAYLVLPSVIESPGDDLKSRILQVALFSFGKLVFVLCDLVTGVLILKMLDFFDGKKKQETQYKNAVLAGVWLLNPMVITISTRGSSESVLTVMLMVSLYSLIVCNQLVVSAAFLGLAVHYKIYPVIYLPSIMLYLVYRRVNISKQFGFKSHVLIPFVQAVPQLALYVAAAAASFAALGGAMYVLYGHEFLFNSYLYHLIRTDHRHNFSVYNMSLYFSSSLSSSSFVLDFSKIAFVPQFLVSAVLIPLVFNLSFNLKVSRSADIGAQKGLLLLVSLFLQTFAFVNYNKVITSQYFIWYLVFLPFFLKSSKFTGKGKITGIACVLVWVLGQALWLYNAYKLEFLGINTFFPALFVSSVVFFVGNSWVLGKCMDDALEVYFR